MGKVHRKSGVKANQNLKTEKGVVRGHISDGGVERNSGSHDPELCKAAAALYSPKTGGLKENH